MITSPKKPTPAPPTVLPIFELEPELEELVEREDRLSFALSNLP